MPKILFFEDDKLLADLYVIKFQSAGFQVKLFADGANPVERAIQEKPDLIISDVMMPVHDGFTVGKMLKADPRTKEIPLIYNTTLGQVEDIAKGKAIGAVEYFVKSDQMPDDLVNYVKEILGMPAPPVETTKERVKKGRRWLNRLLGK